MVMTACTKLCKMTYCTPKKLRSRTASISLTTSSLDRVRAKIARLEKTLEKPLVPNIRPVFIEEDYQIPRIFVELRVRTNLSQRQLAKRMGVSCQTIMQIERVARRADHLQCKPSYDMLQRLAKACRRRVIIMLEGKEHGIERPRPTMVRLQHRLSRSIPPNTHPVFIEEDYQIPRKFAELRMKIGLSQRKLAEEMGVSYSSVERVEAGTGKPSYDMLQRLAKACRRTFVVIFE